MYRDKLVKQLVVNFYGLFFRQRFTYKHKSSQTLTALVLFLKTERHQLHITKISFWATYYLLDVRLIGIRSQSSEDVPDGIDLALNISYSGGFYVSADFTLALNKSVYLSIKVMEISGKVKLSFRRYPASHWSFSFFEVGHTHRHLFHCRK